MKALFPLAAALFGSGRRIPAKEAAAEQNIHQGNPL